MAFSEAQLAMLQVDLGLMHPAAAQTSYMLGLLDTAHKRLAKTGIVIDDGNADHDQLVVMYAAWLYRRRADGAEMPRMLRTAMHDELCHQKMAVDE